MSDLAPRGAKWERAFGDDVCDVLVRGHAVWRRCLHGSHSGAVPPREYRDFFLGLTTDIAHAFETDCNWVNPIVVRYDVGHRFPLHRDWEPHWRFAAGRTVSLSVLLNDPAEFDGGALIVDGHDAELQRGDAAAFTATTWHEVTAVTRGTRYVLVIFGHWVEAEDDAGALTLPEVAPA